MAGQRWRNISDEAYELLRKLLNIDAKLRPTAEQALADPWFTSDPFLVNEATMVMEGIKDQANVNGNSSNIINIPMLSFIRLVHVIVQKYINVSFDISYVHNTISL